VRLLEYRDGENPRFTALLRLTENASATELGYWRKLEALVLNGSLSFANHSLEGGHYARLPALEHPLWMHSGSTYWPVQGHLYVAFAGGNYAANDDQSRTIDTRLNEEWLPGPAEGIEVMPLHVHGSANAMLLRWTSASSFQPNLDPKGEEILVLQGALSDERGRYTAGTWIRNPEISWQIWSGTKDTVIFYKSGHFHASETADE